MRYHNKVTTERGTVFLKRILSLILSAVLLLACCACGQTSVGTFRELEVVGTKQYGVICRKDDKIAPIVNAAVNYLAAAGTLDSVYTMSTGGYACKVVASGSQGNIEMIVGVDDANAVTGVSIVSNAETSGIGSKVMGNELNTAGVPVLDQFIGMSGAGSLVVGKTVTPISGATVSSKGVTAGVNAALAAVEAIG